MLRYNTQYVSVSGSWYKMCNDWADTKIRMIHCYWMCHGFRRSSFQNETTDLVMVCEVFHDFPLSLVENAGISYKRQQLLSHNSWISTHNDLVFLLWQKKLHFLVCKRTIPTELPPLVGESWCQLLRIEGYRVVSAADPNCRYSRLLDRSSYFFFQVAPHLSSWGCGQCSRPTAT
jgi:hypothetical protein